MEEQIEMKATQSEVNTEDQQVETVTDTVSKAEESNSDKRFKTEVDLKNAYTSLEKEFTKRSQRLKALEKEVSESKVNEQPQYQNDDWQQTVDNFLSAHPEAKSFKSEIAKTIMEGDLQKNPNCLELALSKVLIKNFKAPSQLVDDAEFLESYVYANDNIKNRILTDYLKKVSEVRSPKIIGGGGQSAITPSTKPKSFKEAGQMWTQNFK